VSMEKLRERERERLSTVHAVGPFTWHKSTMRHRNNRDTIREFIVSGAWPETMLAILRLKVFSLFLCLRSFDARVYDASPRRRRDPGLHLFELFAPIRRRPHETYAIYVTSEALAEEEAGEARRRAWNSDRADRASECIARVHRAMHASARSRVNWFRALERAIGRSRFLLLPRPSLPRLHARHTSGRYFINGTNGSLASAGRSRVLLTIRNNSSSQHRQHQRLSRCLGRLYASGIDNEPLFTNPIVRPCS